jgi:hypothetical protein
VRNKICDKGYNTTTKRSNNIFLTFKWESTLLSMVKYGCNYPKWNMEDANNIIIENIEKNRTHSSCFELARA